MTEQEVRMPDGTPFPFWEDRTEYTRAYHVAQEHPAASDDNPGTEQKPFATIGRAAAILEPGRKVVVHAGVYRECVRPARGGEGPDRMIAYEAAPQEEVFVKGSEPWKPAFRPSAGWRVRPLQSGPAVWMADLPAEWFVGYNPFIATNMSPEYTTFVEDWSAEETRRMQMKRGMIFADGRPLRQVFRARELAGTDGAFWVEDPGLRIHLRLPGDADPNETRFEVTVREQVFAPAERGLGYVRVAGFHFEHAADGVPVPQRALLSASRGHHWIIEDNHIRWANACGLDVGQESWHASGDEAEGSHIIRSNVVSDCGVCGIAGVHNVKNTLVEGNSVERIGGLDIERIWECGGLKFHRADSVLIRRNVFRHIRNAPGLWLDFLNRNSRITANVFADIESILGGVYIEVSQALNVVDGNVFWDIRGAAHRDGAHGYAGPGVNVDSGDECVVAHNLFGKVRDWYAVSVHLAQAARIVGGRVGLCRRHKVVNNVFVRCPKRILFSRAADNTCDGNLFDAADDPTSFCVEQPQPRAILNLEAWREYYGFDRGGAQARIEADFDPDSLALTWKVEGDLPTCPAVAELHEGAGERSPGPFSYSGTPYLIS